MVSLSGVVLDTQAAWDWQPQPQAAAFVQDVVNSFCADCTPAKELARTLLRQTGTRLSDWIDSLALPEGETLAPHLRSIGFALADDHAVPPVWEHPLGWFPRIELCGHGPRRLAVRVESVEDFLICQGLEGGTPIHGCPFALLRKAKIASGADTELWVVERHGYRGWDPPDVTQHQLQAVLWHWGRFWRRKRDFAREETGFEHARRMIRAAVGDLGAGWTSDLFFSAEREYWTNRNRAALYQKASQDLLGLGWGNHDHHTYRSSREHFARLIAVLEELGFHCRERFYAGREAGWGAQVLEQRESSIVVFADVDLGPDEVSGDFAHEPLAPRDRLGTVGLWCQLHGEAFLQAGMHHLECRFAFDAARRRLRRAGIEVMKPFTDLPYLRQAFTAGEVWAVEPGRVQAASAAGFITRQQADQFQGSGAVGSHLEILQRDEGYKGFNKAGINEIIRATDPRTGPSPGIEA